MIGDRYPTLADYHARMDPDGSMATIIEMLTQRNEIFDDMPFFEGNKIDGHKTTLRSGLPEVAWRALNGGIQPSKSRTVQATESIGMLEALAKVDKAEAELNGNKADWMLSEHSAFLESMSQEFVETLLYADGATEPEKFMGLAPRYSEKAVANAENAENVINAGGTGNTNTSIWLIGWGQDTVHGIFPKGMADSAGIEHTPVHGGQPHLVQAPDGSGEMMAYVDHYCMKAGLVVRDWRYVVRIANIDVDLLGPDPQASGYTGANLPELMGDALELLRAQTPNTAFYTNRRVAMSLRHQAQNTKNVRIGQTDVGGRSVLALDGTPIRRLDKLVNTEAAI